MKRAAFFAFFAFFALLPSPLRAQSVSVTFAWNASESDTRNPAEPNPVKYRLYLVGVAPVGGIIPPGAAPHEAGTALELQVSMAPGVYYAFATAYWAAVTGDGIPAGDGIAESGMSNVLQLRVMIPPGNPANFRVRITGVP